MRVDGSDGTPSHRTLPWLSSTSVDGGKTWSKASPLPPNMLAAHPHATVLGNGALLVTGGRPGLDVWISTDGFGESFIYSYPTNKQIQCTVPVGLTYTCLLVDCTRTGHSWEMYSLPTYHNGLVTSEHKPKHWGYWCASHPIIYITSKPHSPQSSTFVHDTVILTRLLFVKLMPPLQ